MPKHKSKIKPSYQSISVKLDKNDFDGDVKIIEFLKPYLLQNRCSEIIRQAIRMFIESRD